MLLDLHQPPQTRPNPTLTSHRSVPLPYTSPRLQAGFTGRFLLEAEPSTFTPTSPSFHTELPSHKASGGVGDTSVPCWALKTGKQRSGDIFCNPVDGSCTHTGKPPPHPVHEEGLVGAEGDPKILPRTQACTLPEWRATQGHEVPIWHLTGLMLSSISTSHK